MSLTATTARTLAAVGTFRIVPEHDLDGPHDLHHSAPWRCVQALLNYKQRLQLLFFPEGIAYDRNRFNRTAVTGTLFSCVAPSQNADENL